MSVDYFARDPEAIVEPWTPKVGDRVCISLNGECRYRAHPLSHAKATNHPVGHLHYEDGLVGVIVEPDHDAEFFAAQGHPYLVAYVNPILDEGFISTGDYYAAAELQLLEPGR